jgi:AcrR family transcriptional regulator
VRDRLLETALELFLEQGYERTTMDEIANRADVARTTVFNHYPRKAEFLAEWAARRRDKVASGLRHNHVNEQPIGWILDHYMQLMAELNEESPAATKELMPAAIAFDNVLLKPPLAGTLAAYIRRAQRRGEVRADVDPNQAGLMLATTYFSTLINWCDPEPPAFDLRQALHGAVRLVLGGIESP